MSNCYFVSRRRTCINNFCAIDRTGYRTTCQNYLILCRRLSTTSAPTDNIGSNVAAIHSNTITLFSTVRTRTSHNSGPDNSTTVNSNAVTINRTSTITTATYNPASNRSCINGYFIAGYRLCICSNLDGTSIDCKIVRTVCSDSATVNSYTVIINGSRRSSKRRQIPRHTTDYRVHLTRVNSNYIIINIGTSRIDTTSYHFYDRCAANQRHIPFTNRTDSYRISRNSFHGYNIPII